MKMEEVFKHTFKAMRKQLDEQRGAGRRMWQLRQGTSSEFCRAVVSNGYLTEEQMQRAAQRYRLGASRNGGVIFWQIDEFDLLRDGKIMYYRTDCHRDHDRRPQADMDGLPAAQERPAAEGLEHRPLPVRTAPIDGRRQMEDG